MRKQLRRSAHAEVVGRRFPICLVHIKGSVVEVCPFSSYTRLPLPLFFNLQSTCMINLHSFGGSTFNNVISKY